MGALREIGKAEKKKTHRTSLFQLTTCFDAHNFLLSFYGNVHTAPENKQIREREGEIGEGRERKSHQNIASHFAHVLCHTSHTTLTTMPALFCVDLPAKTKWLKLFLQWTQNEFQLSQMKNEQQTAEKIGAHKKR